MIPYKKIIRRETVGYYYDGHGRIQQAIKFFKMIHCPLWNLKYDWKIVSILKTMNMIKNGINQVIKK